MISSPSVYQVLPKALTPEQITEILRNHKPTHSHHTDDDGHQARKDLSLSWVSDIIRERLGIYGTDGVDHMMKLYRLLPGPESIVGPHFDEDYAGPDGSVATHSILINLSDDYTGGETRFNSDFKAQKLAAGDALIFRHDLLHEGLEVTSGVKLVLKTDLFVKS